MDDSLDHPGQDAADGIALDAQRRRREQDVADFKWLMAHKQGRRVMWRLLGMTGLFRNPFVPDGSGSTFFRCGEQNIGQKLIVEIHQLCPEHYHTMVKEAQEQAKRFGATSE